MEITVIEAEIKQLESSCEQYRKKRNVVAGLRFIVFIAMLGSVIAAYQLNAKWYMVSAISLVVFIVLIAFHDQIKQSLFYRECKLEVWQDMLARKNHDWVTFNDDGHDFITNEDLTAKDLDLFGSASLFQYLNCAATPYGRRDFSDYLKQGCDDREILNRRQVAVAELANHPKFSIAYMTCSKIFAKQRNIKEKTVHKIAEAAKSDQVLPGWMRLLQVIGPTIMVMFILMTIIGKIPWQIVFAWFIIQVALAMLVRKACDEQLALLSHTQVLMDVYQQMFQMMEAENSRSPLLNDFHQQITGATKATKKLSTFIGFANARSNDITFTMGSGFFLMDLQFVAWYRGWKRQYGSQLETWMKIGGEMEALLSLALLKMLRSDVCMPAIDEKQEIAFTAIKHPLLDEAKAIPNDFALNKGTCVITGSNMSGKTTFLRTIGVNMTLFKAGGYVCADTWSSPIMKIYTSMRVEDNVDAGISTFYAEILRIKTMMNAMENHQPMLVLIDEIFKGTNSADRIIGAQEAVKRLHQPWVTTFVSTHDFELCSLQDDPNIQACNMHFREYYEADEIHFDYQLRKGRCQTTNARQLMRMAGIITK